MIACCATHQFHAFLVEAFVADVAIVYVEGLSFLPFGCVLAEVLQHGAYPQGMNLAVGIFPPLLQEAKALAHVFPFQGLTATESRLADTFPSRREVLIVELHGLWLPGERYAGIHLAHGV